MGLKEETKEEKTQRNLENTEGRETVSLSRTPSGQVITIGTGTDLKTGIKMRLDDDVGISISSEYGPLIGNKTNDLFTVLSANIAFMKDLGLSGQNKYLGYQIWKKSDPIEVTITAFLFVDEETAGSKNLQNLKNILSWVVPSESSKIPGNLVPPGPSLKTLFDELTKAGEPKSSSSASGSSISSYDKIETDRIKVGLWKSALADQYKFQIDLGKSFMLKNPPISATDLATLNAYSIEDVEKAEKLGSMSDLSFFGKDVSSDGVLFKKGVLDKYKIDLAINLEKRKQAEDIETGLRKATLETDTKLTNTWVRIGGYLKFNNVVFTKVQPVFSSITTGRYPLSITLQLEFKTIVTVTDQEIDKMFVYPWNEKDIERR